VTRYLVGVDVGGTFTDFVSYDVETGAMAAWKNLSTPDDPTDGVLTGLKRFARPDEIAHIRLGTTIATNAILERKGATVAYLTTRGFRDVPFIQRGNRRSHYDITWIKPKPLVEHRHCLEVDERIDRYGQVVAPLDEAGLRALAGRLREAGEVQSIAVSFLFSFLDPRHERQAAEILRAALPEVPISISFEVVPKWKEYERASTTIADAYLKPVIAPRLTRMRKRLAEVGVPDRVAVIRSNGGEMTLDAAAAAPIHMAVSGPTGGVIGAKQLARLLRIDHLVTFDMGGTSTDCATIVNGTESFTSSFEIEWGVPIQIPMVDVRTIGAGGGSIAWIDKGGLLRVGPQSAGASPGPACYGRGGEEATVTDAQVVLGRINPANFLGGSMRLDAERAAQAVGRIARRIGQDVEQAALAIVRIANNNMVGALRAVLIERGLDPRDFALLAFGGAGPPHACDLMHELGIGSGIVPNHPGQFSAFGFIMTDARVDRHRTLQQTSPTFDRVRASETMRELVAAGLADLKQQGYGEPIKIQRSIEMRYHGQNYELEVPVPFDVFDERTTPALWEAFHDLHQQRFGFSIRGQAIEIVNFMVTVTALTPKPDFAMLSAATGEPEAVGRRRVVYDDGPHDTPVFDRATLRQGHRIAGPAVIEEAASVTLLRPGQALSVDQYGNLRIA
jgi:N-methylhydantoinase A